MRKSLQVKETQVKQQFHDTVQISEKQYKALQKQMIATLPKERHREVIRQAKEERMRKIAMLALQYERTIADMGVRQEEIVMKSPKSLVCVCAPASVCSTLLCFSLYMVSLLTFCKPISLLLPSPVMSTYTETKYNAFGFCPH